MFGSGGKRKARRIEPRFDDSPVPDDDLRADPEDRPVPRRKDRKPKGKAPPVRRRRSLIGALFYWSFVLGIWGAIGLTGLCAYYASQLPPIDQLAIPKRPPNIAILGADGTLLATLVFSSAI